MNCQHPGQPDTEDGGCILCWKERCESAEAAAAETRDVLLLLQEQRNTGLHSGPTSSAVNHALSSSCGQDFVPRSELEKANACCAELRAWAEETWANCSCFKEPPKMDCGHGYLPPDKAKVLVEALEKAKEIIVRIGTTDCGCEDTKWYRNATSWLNDYPALAQLKETQ